MYCNTARSFPRLTLWIACPARSLVAMENLKHMASILASMVSCPLVAWSVNPDFWYFHSHCCCNGHAAEQQNQHGSPCLPPSIGPQGEHGEKRQMQYFNTQWLIGRCWKKACQLSWFSYTSWPDLPIAALLERIQCIQTLQSIQSRNKLGVFLMPRALKSLPAANQRVLSPLCRSSSE